MASIALFVFSLSAGIYFANLSIQSAAWSEFGLGVTSIISLHSVSQFVAATATLVWGVQLTIWLYKNADTISENDLDSQTPSVGDAEFPRISLRIATSFIVALSLAQLITTVQFVRISYAWAVAVPALILAWSLVSVGYVFGRPQNQRFALGVIVVGVFLWLSQFLLSVVFALNRDLYDYYNVTRVSATVVIGWFNWIGLSAWLGFAILWLVNAREDKGEISPRIVMPMLAWACAAFSVGYLAIISINFHHANLETGALTVLTYIFSFAFAGLTVLWSGSVLLYTYFGGGNRTWAKQVAIAGFVVASIGFVGWCLLSKTVHTNPDGPLWNTAVSYIIVRMWFGDAFVMALVVAWAKFAYKYGTSETATYQQPINGGV